MISFKNIPSNIRVPLYYAELDASHANTASSNQRALIIGQLISGGSGVVNVPVISAGVADAKTQYGAGSMLAQMVDSYRQNDSFGEVWCLPLADDGAAVAAAGAFAFTHAATANGVLSLYIAGVLVSMPVLTTQSISQLATALSTLINANTDLPVTSSPTAGSVALTAKNLGAAGNDIDIQLNYNGTLGGEATPVGLTYTITAMASGATNPSLTTALANCADAAFDFIVFPYTDTTSLDAIKAFLNDSVGRWSWDRQVYGHAFAAYRGTVGARTTLGVARNDQHTSIMGFNSSPTPEWRWAAAVAGASAVSLRADPGRPLQTLALNGVLAPPVALRDALTDRNTLLFDGISTYDVAGDGTCSIENLITTYQLNAFNQPDNSYLEVETLFLLMYILRRQKGLVTTKYSRVKLAADGTRFAPGTGIVTPNMIRADLIADYQDMEFNGFVQNSPAFAAALIVEIDGSNPNRINVLYPPSLIDQLRIFAVLAQFRLS